MQPKWIETPTEIKMNWRKYANLIQINKEYTSNYQKVLRVHVRAEETDRWTVLGPFTNKTEAKKRAWNWIAARAPELTRQRTAGR